MRQLVVGLEDVVDLTLRPEWLDAARFDEIAITVGRVDRVGFPWAGHRIDWHPLVKTSRRDFVAEAIAVLGNGRRVNIMVDCLIEAWIDREPSLAGVDARGERSELCASVASIQSVVGDRIVDLCETVRERYRPDAITLTDLFLNPFTFGDADQRSFGRDWPRRRDGTIEETHPDIQRWRADAVTRLATRVGAPLDVEVRASWDGPKSDPGPDGQDWAALSGIPARIVVWGYFALRGRQPSALRNLDVPIDGSLSIGLWGRVEEETITPEQLALALDAVGDRPTAISPASRLSQEHWEVLWQT